jgi:hypothetical protein
VDQKKVRVHKFTFEVNNGPLPAGKLVMHSCDMTCCWNPDHLNNGTHKSNREDAMVKGRLPKGETATGAKLTDQDVAAIRASSETHRALGAKFGVSHNIVGRIKRYQKWRHLP